MEITHNEPDMLIFDDRPIVMGLVFAGIITFLLYIGINMLVSGALFGVLFLILAAIAMLLGALFVRRSQVVFHRPENWLEIRSRSLRGSKTIRHRLDKVENALLVVKSSSSSSTKLMSERKKLHRVELVFPDGESVGNHPITHYFSSSEDHAYIAEAINRWLDSEPTQA